MNMLLQDIRFAFRMMWKTPGFTLLAIMALAVGIGANTTIFSMVNALLLSPLPFPDMERMMRIYETHKQNGRGNENCSGPNYLDWKERSTSFESISLITTDFYNLTGEGQPQRVTAYIVTNDLFNAKMFKMAYGRTFLTEETKEGKNHAALLGYGLWQKKYGGNLNILNQTIKLDSVPYTVVGILPKELGFLEGEANIWLPLTDERIRGKRNDRYYTAMGKLKPGVTIKQAQAEMDIISKNLAKEYPDDNRDWEINVESMFDKVLHFLAKTFTILHTAVAFVLLISCSIVASLLLARSGVRRKEIAIRSALGAKRIYVIRQLLTESIIIALMGGAAGLFFTVWGVEYLASHLGPVISDIIRMQGINHNLLLFTVLISILTGLLFGIIPAWQTSKVNLSETLKEGGKGSGAGFNHRLLKCLVIMEIALALILLNGTGLLVHSFINIVSTYPGFDATKILTFHFTLSEKNYQEDFAKRAFYRDALRQVESLPGVISTAVSQVIPQTVNFSPWTQFEIQSKDRLSGKDRPSAQIRQINTNYFQAMKIPLLKGRPFNAGDEQEDSYNIIVDARFAEKHFPKEEVIGAYLKIQDCGDTPFQIVGIVGNSKQYSLRSDFNPTIYIPYLHTPSQLIGFAIRTDGDPVRLGLSIQKIFGTLAPNIPIEDLRTMEEAIKNKMDIERMSITLLTIFSAVALFLSAMGIYGIMAYSVSQRTQEIGIRMALGAQLQDVINLILKEGLKLTLTGLVIGVTLSLAVMKMLTSVLYGVTASDPITFIGVSVLLTGVALLASYIPARRAAKIDPMITLRYE